MEGEQKKNEKGIVIRHVEQQGNWSIVSITNVCKTVDILLMSKKHNFVITVFPLSKKHN